MVQPPFTGVHRKEKIMENKTFSIPNISCGHCVMSIKNELSELEGVKTVEGDPERRTVTVSWESPTTLQTIQDTLKEINYPAQ
jgi:copper chaperone